MKQLKSPALMMGVLGVLTIFLLGFFIGRNVRRDRLVVQVDTRAPAIDVMPERGSSSTGSAAGAAVTATPQPTSQQQSSVESAQTDAPSEPAPAEPSQTSNETETLPESGATVPPQPGQTDGLININTATADQLTALPGIGPKLAQRIVDYRNEHGAFTDITEIMHVEGIADKRFNDICDLITVR